MQGGGAARGRHLGDAGVGRDAAHAQQGSSAHARVPPAAARLASALRRGLAGRIRVRAVVSLRLLEGRGYCVQAFYDAGRSCGDEGLDFLLWVQNAGALAFATRFG